MLIWVSLCSTEYLTFLPSYLHILHLLLAFPKIFSTWSLPSGFPSQFSLPPAISMVFIVSSSFSVLTSPTAYHLFFATLARCLTNEIILVESVPSKCFSAHSIGKSFPRPRNSLRPSLNVLTKSSTRPYMFYPFRKMGRKVSLEIPSAIKMLIFALNDACFKHLCHPLNAFFIPLLQI